MKVLLFLVWLLTTDIVPPPPTPTPTTSPQTQTTTPAPQRTGTFFKPLDFSFLQRPNINLEPYTPPSYPDHTQEENCEPIYYEGQPSGVYDCD